MINSSGSKMEAQTYYAVQHGLIATIAYYSSEDSWFIPGQPEIKNSNLNDDFIVYAKVMTHNEVVALQPSI